MIVSLVVGSFRDDERSRIEGAARQANAECVFVNSVPNALVLLNTLDEPPRCIFCSLNLDIAGLIESLRNRVDYYTVPVVALVAYPSAEAYQKARQLGADDSILEHDVGAMSRRLENLTSSGPRRLPEANSGKALVAISDGEKRRAVGKKLRSAGYCVDFVADEAEVYEKSLGAIAPALVVATPSLFPQAAQERLQYARGELDRVQIPSVVLPSATSSLVSPRLLSETEVADHLMFLIDEAHDRCRTDVRRSRRLRHAAICTFRDVRSFEFTYALTDNLSREGLYLRTMDPPAIRSEVRIEVRSLSGDILHIHCKVAWRHAPSHVGGTTAPGFGVSIDEAACSAVDLRQYQEAYDSLLNYATSVAGIAPQQGLLPDDRRTPEQSREAMARPAVSLAHTS